MLIRPHDTLGTIVGQNLQAATVLNEYGIDYFTKGNRSLETACLEENAPMATVVEELSDLNNKGIQAADFENMSLTELSVYILKTHHRFAEKKVTFITHALARLTREYNDEGHAMGHLQQKFNDLSLYLTVHMRHEEHVVFPFIQKLTKSKTAIPSLASSILQPIAAMREDHFYEVATLKELSRLTNKYSVSKNADYALQIAYGAMRELEDDLKIHMHLENNILFPKTLTLAYSNSKDLSQMGVANGTWYNYEQ